MGFSFKRVLAWVFDILHISDLMMQAEQKKYGKQYIRILNYHETHGSAIRTHILWLKKHYQNVSYEAFKSFLKGESLTGDKPGIMFTFDDGHISNYESAMRVLDAEMVTGYYMVSSDLIGKPGYMSKEQIEVLLMQGHMVGCHTATHHRMAASDNAELLDYEIKQSKKKLEEMFHIPVEIFCWCGGEEYTYTVEAEKVIETSGYKYGFMTNSYPVLMDTDRFHIQRINIEDNWSISLLKFQICGFMDRRMKDKRKRVDKTTRRLI